MKTNAVRECDVYLCGERAVHDLGRYQRVTGLTGEVRYLCDRHRPRTAGADFGLTLEAAAERIRADRDRRGGSKRGEVQRLAKKYGLDATALAQLL